MIIMKYGLVLGWAIIYYNKAVVAVGFYDSYDFNFLPWGRITFINKMKIHMVRRAGALHGVSPYNIYYGIGIKLQKWKGKYYLY